VKRSVARPRSRPRAAQGGVALAMLVWFIAAMMLLVAGIVVTARVDIKLTQLHAERARAEAAGDGAIALALAELMVIDSENEVDTSLVFGGQYNVGGLDVTVRFQPVSGLVDLNRAPEELLALLFASLDDVEEARAVELAASMVEWRTAPGDDAEDGDAPVADSGLRHARFETIEDLLLVPGMDRDIFAGVREAVYVGQRGQSGVDWMAAPARVLQAIGGFDAAQAAALSAKLVAAGDREEAVPSELDLRYQEAGNLALYRVDAIVPVGEERFLRRRWVERGRSGADDLPWRFFRTEAVRAAGTLEPGYAGR
tara:strand:- start:2274 stop:3209 length:936 start_codon:yes stop_codon:yes gene_type:complete